MDESQKVIEALLSSRYGLRPYDPAVNKPQDVGLGGPSTEYLATANDPYGQPFNYPQIWYDMNGNPHLLEGDAAYNQAVDYEVNSGVRFPRYDTMGAAETFAQNRSIVGGAEKFKLGSILGTAGY